MKVQIDAPEEDLRRVGEFLLGNFGSPMHAVGRQILNALPKVTPACPHQAVPGCPKGPGSFATKFDLAAHLVKDHGYLTDRQAEEEDAEYDLWASDLAERTWRGAGL